MPEFLQSFGPELLAALLAGLAALFASKIVFPRISRARGKSDELIVRRGDELLEAITFDRDEQGYASIVNAYLRDEDLTKRAFRDQDFTITESHSPTRDCDFLARRGDEVIAVEVKSNFSESTKFWKDLKKWVSAHTSPDLPDSRLLFVFDHSDRIDSSEFQEPKSDFGWEIRTVKAPKEYMLDDERLDQLRKSIELDLTNWMAHRRHTRPTSTQE